MRSLKVTVREQDEGIWDQAKTIADAEYLPFSRFLTKVLAEYLEQHHSNGKEEPQ